MKGKKRNERNPHLHLVATNGDVRPPWTEAVTAGLTATDSQMVTDAVVLDEREGGVQHRDLGQILPTELDGITINRTKTKVDPFIPIRKERLVDQLTGAPSKAFGVWVPDPGSPQGWRDMGTVSENYLLLTNREVRDLALEIAGASGLPHKESRIFWDGARFGHVIDFTDAVEEVVPGDAVGLSLITRTSYDKSWKYEAALMGKRFVCDNGVLSGEFFARISFKHIGGEGGDGGSSSGDEGWKEIVRQGLSVLHEAPEDLHRFAHGLRLLKQMPTTDDHLRRLWTGYGKLGDALLGKVMARYLAAEEPTLFGLLQAGTHVFWHNQKMTSADFQNNDLFSTGLLQYAFEYQS